MRILQRLWNDDGGALIATEYLFISTILVIGTVVGLTGLRYAVNVELTELGNALLVLSQGFSVSGQSGGGGQTSGSQASDSPGSLQPPVLVPPSNPSSIDVAP